MPHLEAPEAADRLSFKTAADTSTGLAPEYLGPSSLNFPSQEGQLENRVRECQGCVGI